MFISVPNRSLLAEAVIALCVGMAICVFTGAFFEQLILGPSMQDAPTLQQRIQNSLMYVPFYGIFLLFALLNPPVTIRCLRCTSFQLLAILLFVALLMLPFAYNRVDSLREVLTLALTCSTAIGIVAAVKVGRFLRILFWTMAIIVVASVGYLILLPSWGWYDNQFSLLDGTPKGVFRHKNTLAEIMSVSAIVALTAKSVCRWPFRLIVILASISVLILTGSTNKIVGLVFGIITWQMWLRSTKRGLHPSVPLAFLAIASASALLAVLLFGDKLLNSVGEDITLTGRIYLWQHSWQHLQDKLFTGFGAASIWGSKLGSVPELPNFQPTHAHNTLIELALRYGMPGTFCAFWFVIKIVADLAKGVKETHPALAPAIAILASLIARSPFEVTLFTGNSAGFLLILVLIGYLYTDTAVSTPQQMPTAA